MGIKCNFEFAELAIKFLETGEEGYLEGIAKTDGAAHIFNHASRYNNAKPDDTVLSFITRFITPIDKHRESLPQVKENLDYAKKHIAASDTAEKIALQYLPKDFSFTGTIFFTFGYDIGVAFGNNCSLNIANPIFLRKDKIEMMYYAIHEMHHAGFIQLRDDGMLSLDISTYEEMASLIELATFIEGMGTYAPLAIREEEGAMDADSDYRTLQDPELMEQMIKEFLDIYRYFKDSPDKALTEDDWQKVSVLSGGMNGKRHWYIVGAHMARAIDEAFGREYLVGLIGGDSEGFIKSYMKL